MPGWVISKTRMLFPREKKHAQVFKASLSSKGGTMPASPSNGFINNPSCPFNYLSRNFRCLPQNDFKRLQ